MKVVTAKSAGFCFGVQRAVDQVYRMAEEKKGNICTLGPIIHNEEVIRDLEQKGVRVISEEDIPSLKDTTVIIRSHGVGKAVYDLLEENHVPFVDVTCPFVLKIHKIVREESAAGKYIVIIGDKDHPEVKGICGWCKKKPLVIAKETDIPSEISKNEIFVVSQTTFNLKNFNKIVAKLQENSYNMTVVNTICNATQRRQSEAEDIASRVDAMIVIGGSQSSNTRKLCDICRANCVKTYYIQSVADLSNLGFSPVRSVGITAGASTPKKIIEEVQSYVRNKF